MTRRTPRHGTFARAGAASAILHAAALLAAWAAHHPGGAGRAAPPPAQPPPAQPPAPPAAAPVAAITLIDDIPPGLPLQAVTGPGDRASWNPAHPLPRADADIPGERAADPGGGDRGGPESWTGRRDPHPLHSRVWNDPARNRQPRARTARDRASPELLARAPDPGRGDRTHPGRRARAGHPAATPGAPDAPTAPPGAAGSAATAPPRRDDPDPLLDAAIARARPRRRDGTTAPADRALTDRGPPATEALRRGSPRDDADSADRSSAANPGPFELTRPAAGGPGDGVRGELPRPGVSAAGTGRADAATRRDVPARRGALAVVAHRHHPYFRAMYRRIDRGVAYPRDLALRLEQGRVVVRFTLSAGGDVSAVEVARSSGFEQFDREVARAVQALGPLGPVPAALLGGRAAITVQAPYTFRNQLIR